MQLTGKQIVERGIITNYCEEGIQQQGIDVRLDQVIDFNNRTSMNNSEVGYVPVKGKTKLIGRKPIKVQVSSDGTEVFHLEPGYYEIIVKEGCKMPNNAAMRFISRSSLVRNGAIIHCGQFDAGFETDVDEQNARYILHFVLFIIPNAFLCIQKGRFRHTLAQRNRSFFPKSH